MKTCCLVGDFLSLFFRFKTCLSRPRECLKNISCSDPISVELTSASTQKNQSFLNKCNKKKQENSSKIKKFLNLETLCLDRMTLYLCVG